MLSHQAPMHGSTHTRPRVEALAEAKPRTHLTFGNSSAAIPSVPIVTIELQWDPELNFYVFAVMAS